MIRRRSLRIPVDIRVGVGPCLIRVVVLQVEITDLSGSHPASSWADVAILSNNRWIYPVTLCPGLVEYVPSDLSGTPF